MAATPESKNRKPLAGIKVIDVSRFIAGPFCAQMLGDMGAEVIKVEGPEGEPGRHISPIVNGQSLYFVVYNRGKKGVAIDLRSESGRGALRRLLGDADVLIDNFRPGVMEDMGLGREAMARDFPRLIHATVLGFGRQGPYADLPCFDEIAQAMGGLLALCGEEGRPPVLPGTYVADLATGLYLVSGILLALRVRETQGVAQKVDVSLFDAVFSLLHTTVPQMHLTGQPIVRSGNQNRGIAPGNLYRARDGYIIIEAITQKMWESLAGLMGRRDLLDDPRLATPALRRNHAGEIDEAVAAWIVELTVDQAFQKLSAAGIACGPVREPQSIVHDPQVEANRMITTVTHPTLGELPLPNVVIRLSKTPGSIQGPPPLVGEHNAEILEEKSDDTGDDCRAEIT
ncbi:MAG: CoA transferase [Rhodospirillales bacterium]|nr:CoA transferase [Rhodospirillales bacterium]